jgi:flagellar motor switch protein FliM
MSDAKPEDILSDVLTQSEVEDILASISGSSDVKTKVISREGKTREVESVQKHDFRSPVFITPAEMRRLRIKHDEFIRTLALNLSVYLRSEMGLQMARLETIAYKNLLETLPVPSHITLFRLKPLDGICFIDITPRLALTIIDRMMGGPGHSIKGERELTDIEEVTLQQFINIVLKAYCESWIKYQEVSYDLMEHENTAKFLNIVEPDEIMLFMEIEARLGDCVAGIRFILPYKYLKELVKKMMDEVSSHQVNKYAQAEIPLNVNSPYLNIAVPVIARWNGLGITLKDLSNLNTGDILMLDPKKCSEAIIHLGNVPKFLAAVNKGQTKTTLTVKGKIG